MEPPRGRWSNLAWASAVLTFIPVAVVGEFAAWFQRTTWLRLLDHITGIVFLLALAICLYLRGREVITYRRRLRTGP